MFPKLPTHLRPFLGRIPTASPDLFTPNPSLLHHLPQGGSSSHGLVSQAQSQAQAQAGGAAGAGRTGQGYQGGSAGSGGGYTGHARAFTSLSQTSADPSSGIRDDDNANTKRDSRRKRRQSISFRPPYHRPITVIEEPVSLASRLRILSSSGAGAGLKAVEIQMEAEAEEGLKELRTTIPQPESDIAIARTSSPTLGPVRPSGLGRSRSTLDLYTVGIPLPRSPSSLRAYSSISRTASPVLELGIDDRVPALNPLAAKRIVQPNRVLMDLAGIDLPRSGSRRPYATATATATAATDENIDYPTSSDANEADRRIYSAIHHASLEGRRDFVTSLISHYRSPRDEPSPYAELESHLPRPEGYTAGTYNICMSALLSVRKQGESIAPLLEIYNEMLERDVLPNGRTYVNVIRALCLREKDVQAAVQQHQDSAKWAQFKSSSLSTADSNNTPARGDEAIKGYLSEGNFESAYNLFIGIKNVQTASAPDGFYRFLPPVYSYLLDSIASQVHPSPSAYAQAEEIFNHACSTDTSSHRSLYRHMFRLLATLNDGPKLSQLWERFESERAGGAGSKLREWKDVLPGTEVEEREVQVEGFQREVWVSAVRAFIATGNVDKGMEILATMEERAGTNLKATMLREAPRIKAESYGSIAISLAQAGEYELSHQVLLKAGDKLRPIDMGLYIDALVLGGKWKLALDTYLPYLSTRPEDVRPDATRIKRIYTAILADATFDPSLLSHIQPLMATGTYILDTDLAVAHIRILLAQKAYGSIAGVMDSFGPMETRLEYEERHRSSRLLEEIAATEIELPEMLDVIKAFSRQRTNIILDQQNLVGMVIDKYLASRDSLASLEPGQWSALLSTFSRTVGKGLDEGEYDAALEAFVSDLKAHAPKTLERDTEGRYTRALAERLFNRFGSEKAIALLNPLASNADEMVNSLFTPSTPELDPSSPTLSSSSRGPLTPPPNSNTAGLRIDENLSRRLDSHLNRTDKNSITAQRAYSDLRAALSRTPPSAPSPESLSRLMITLARESSDSDAQPRVLELYALAQQIIPLLPTNRNRQESAWRHTEDAMLISQCHLGHLEAAGLHRHRLVERGMAPSADAYATMIASSKDTTDDAQVARELWEESRVMGVVPHLYLYNTVISKLSKARKAEVALEMFAQMKERGVRPSSVTYGAVINACCRVGDAESAETLFAEMSSQPNFRPRVPPYNTMMQFYLQTRPSRERVLHYYSSLRSSGVPPSAHTYKLLLDTYHTLAPIDLTAMERTFAELCADRSTKVQGTHWASLITAYGISAVDVAKAIEVFEVIPTHPANRGNNPLSEPVVWEAILNVLGTKGSLEEMEAMRKRMEGSNARPTAYVYNVLISGYARHGQMDVARGLFESMADTSSGHSAPNNHPSPQTKSTSTPTEGKGEGQIYREPSTYETMIKAELAQGDTTRAEAVLRRMEERRYPVAVYMKARALVDGAAAATAVGGVQGGYTPFPAPTPGVEAGAQA